MLPMIFISILAENPHILLIRRKYLGALLPSARKQISKAAGKSTFWGLDYTVIAVLIQALFYHKGIFCTGRPSFPITGFIKTIEEGLHDIALKARMFCDDDTCGISLKGIRKAGFFHRLF